MTTFQTDLSSCGGVEIKVASLFVMKASEENMSWSYRRKLSNNIKSPDADDDQSAYLSTEISKKEQYHSRGRTENINQQNYRLNSVLIGLSGFKCLLCSVVRELGIQRMNMIKAFGRSDTKAKQQIGSLTEEVAQLRMQVQKQRAWKDNYKYQVRRLQNYLRYCLQIAQENGFIDIILGGPLFDDSLGDPYTSIENETLEDHSVDCSTFRLNSMREKAWQNGWYVDTYEIQIHEQVGKGATADIFRGTWRGLDVAVKCIRPDFFERNEEGIEWFCQELEMLSRQRHPYVLQLMGACLSPPYKAWLITELLSSRTLTEWLYGQKERRKQRTTPLPSLNDRLRIGLEIAQGMQYLHEQKPKVMHRDLKPTNIFLDDNLHARVADFGHARFLSDGERALTGETGTYVYMAPEVVKSEPYDEKCDVYSYGVILCELLTGRPPYIDSDYSPKKIAFEVAAGNLRPTLSEDEVRNGGLIHLICCAWHQDPSKRPSFENITCTLRKIQKEIFS